MAWALENLDGISRSYMAGPLAVVLCLGGIQANAITETNGARVDGQSVSLMVSSEDVSSSIRLAADYLKRNCGTNGSLLYLIDVKSHKELPGYDIIRHAGAIYSLGMYDRQKADNDAVDAMFRAGLKMRANYMRRQIFSGAPMTVVWMDQIHSGLPLYTDLGANSIGLMAFAEIERVQPGWISNDELESMGRFIVFMQKSEGSFFSRYRDQKGPVQNFDCLYYPGEAVCGLVSLYELDHDDRWLKASGRALDYLARTRAGKKTVPADHWALIATAKLWPYAERANCPVTHKELVGQAIQICNAILGEQILNSTNSAFDGGFSTDGETTPTATRLEGLMSALEFLPEDESGLRANIEASVRRGIIFLVHAQIKTGVCAGGMPGSAGDGSTRASTVVRIDFVEHAMLAMLHYQRLCQPGK